MRPSHLNNLESHAPDVYSRFSSEIKWQLSILEHPRAITCLHRYSSFHKPRLSEVFNVTLMLSPKHTRRYDQPQDAAKPPIHMDLLPMLQNSFWGL